MRQWTTIAILILQILMAIALLVLSTQFRSPNLANVRLLLLGILLGISPILIGFGLLQLRNQKGLWQNATVFGITFLTTMSLTITISTQAQFYWQKYQVVLNAPQEKIAPLGKHFIIGYKNAEEIIPLIEKRAIAGVFITTRNIRDRTYSEIQNELNTFQTLRKSQGLPPLWIATDQEGGIVSRLSPPLTSLPSLGKIVSEAKDPQTLKKAVIEYATTQGKELSDLGINVNFAPVVDLNQGVINPRDRYSQIYRRAISDNSETVTNVARWYCDTLAEFNVQCTLKHFPGLGRVENDTHITDAELNTPILELKQEDWVPFQSLMKDTTAWTMLSHVKLTPLDNQNPVSFSPQIIQNLIREQWNYQGILITDDICMKAFYKNAQSIHSAAHQALNSTVDLLLIAYDPDLYYPVLAHLLQDN